MNTKDQSGEYLTGPKVSLRYGVTSMTIWRWLKSPEMNFPKPVYFGRLRYWRISELEAWERAQAAKGPARQSGVAAGKEVEVQDVGAT